MASQEGLENYVNDPSNIRAAKKILKQQGNEDPTSEEIGLFLTEEYQKNKSSNVGALIGKGLKKMKKALGKKAKINFLPLQPGDVPDTYANVNNLVKEFNYKPSTTINEGISNFVKWYKDYYKI